MHRQTACRPPADLHYEESSQRNETATWDCQTATDFSWQRDAPLTQGRTQIPHSSSYPCIGLLGRLGTASPGVSSRRPSTWATQFPVVINLTVTQVLTGIRRRDRLPSLVAQRLANGRDGDEHDGPNEAYDDRVEDDGLFMCLPLLLMALRIKKRGLKGMAEDVRGSGMSA